MKLVDDWKQAWKWISMNCMMIATVLQGAWMGIPDDMKTSVPEWLVHAMTIIILVLGIAGRLVKQDAPPAV